MAIAELLPIAATAGSQSSPRTIASGVVERIGLKATGRIPPDANIEIQFKDDVGEYRPYHALVSGGQRNSCHLQGPVTYRLERKGGTCGAYVES
jgi:hypothetical protein